MAQKEMLTSYGYGETMIASVMGGIKTSGTVVKGTEAEGIGQISTALNTLGTTANEVDLRTRMLQKTILNFNILGQSVGA